jgi:hypothetical protein
MAEGTWEDLIAQLRFRGIAFDAGLTDTEVASAESRFEFQFPPDLREFLQTALPRGRRLPDWRAGEEAAIRDWLDMPRRGVVFDVGHNGFWLDEWGTRPQSMADAMQLAEQLVKAAPRLIPVYMNRMLPAEPHLAGNPVFSVHQTDIIVYGTELRDYFAREFLMTEDEQAEWTIPTGTRPIRFWDTDRFQAARWGADGSCIFDNSRGQLP